MFNAINKVFARANAEGWNPLSLKKAIDNQIKFDLEKAIKEWENSFSCHEPVADQEVVSTLTREYYAGGYMYSRSKVSPSKFQAWCSTNAPSIDGDTAGALEWVKTAPVGEKVHYLYNAGNGKTEEVFEKSESGWVRIFFMYEPHKPSEDNGPWLTAGIRERVAKRVGAPLSSTFHQVFDEAVKDLY